MPRMGGIDCARAIRAEWPAHDTPIVAITADAFEESRARCIEAGMAGWLSKPFRVDGLMAVWQGVGEAKRARDAAAAAAPAPAAQGGGG
jgi:CheY-like chemotaxis protein